MRRRRRRRREGAHLVEFALVVPILLLLLFGLYEYGRLLMVRHVMQAAAREGARYAVVHTNDKTTADVEAVVNGYLNSMGTQFDGGAAIAVYKCDPASGASLGTWTDAGISDAIAVEISGVYKPVLPVFLLMPSSVNMQVKAAMYSEAN